MVFCPEHPPTERKFGYPRCSMGHRGQACSILALIALTVAPGCQPEFPEVSWKGRFLHVAQTAAGEVCSGSNPYQDRYVEILAHRLDIEIDEPLRFAYIETAELQDYCFQDDIRGCYYDGNAYSTTPVQTHELAHAVADRAGWMGPRAFSEGFAEAFGGDFDAGTQRLPIREVVEHFEVSPDHYYTAALFVRFLIERHGVQLLGDFMRGTERDDELVSISEDFEAVFSEPLESAFADFDGYPACSAWANHDAIVECSLPDLVWDGDVLKANVPLDCSLETVVGPFVPGPRMWDTRAFSVSEDGDYIATVTTTGTSDAGVRITRCGTCVEHVDEIVPADASGHPVRLRQGRYYVIFVADVSDISELSLSLEPAL